ncbi:MAG: hypothetical protein R2788_13375 [Saprospiraceae bacterium]
MPSTSNTEDLSILPNGDIAIINNANLSVDIYSPPSSIPVVVPLNPSSLVYGSLLFNGLLYIYAENGLYYLDPTTNQITYVGAWPAGMPSPAVFELYESSGQIYLMEMYGNPGEIWQVDLTNPSNSTYLQQVPTTPGVIISVTSVGNDILFIAEEWLNSYNPASNSFSQECNLNDLGIFGAMTGLTYLPSGVAPPPCLCTTDAGTVSFLTSEICLPEEAVVPFNNDATLNSDDLLQYILFSNLSDTLGSILVTSNTASIGFNPITMQTGVTYYLATIAGDNLNGNVNLTDDCLSISNASEVVWWPQPSVSFAAPNPDVCVGGCITLEVTLTGTPPFGLTGEILTGANVVGTFNENFLQNNGTLNACAPLGTAPGSLSVQATTLSDANCSCL